MTDKTADLAGPGIGNYEDLEKILPADYRSILTPKETMKALYAAKTYIEDHLCEDLNLMMVQVPLIVDSSSGVNDYLDRDGSRSRNPLSANACRCSETVLVLLMPNRSPISRIDG